MVLCDNLEGWDGGGERRLREGIYVYIPQIAKILKKNKTEGIMNPDFKLYYKTIGINTIRYWPKKKQTHTVSENSLESPEMKTWMFI